MLGGFLSLAMPLRRCRKNRKLNASQDYLVLHIHFMHVYIFPCRSELRSRSSEKTVNIRKRKPKSKPKTKWSWNASVLDLTKNTKNCTIFRMPFGSEFHLSHLRQSLHLPSGIGMAFSGTPFGSEFHLSRLRQSLLSR